MFKNKPADNGDTTTNFKLRGPYGNYRPIDYKIYTPFANLRNTLDGHLAKLFAGSTIDEGNKDVLDPIVNDIYAQAVQDTNKQKIDHADNIHIICNRRAGDKLGFEGQLAQLKEALEENEEELEEIQQRFKVNKF